MQSLHENTLPPQANTTALEARKYVDVDYGAAGIEGNETEEGMYEEITHNQAGGTSFRPERNSVQLMTYNHAYHSTKFDF